LEGRVEVGNKGIEGQEEVGGSGHATFIPVFRLVVNNPSTFAIQETCVMSRGKGRGKGRVEGLNALA
jgi:hypothetical protein